MYNGGSCRGISFIKTRLISFAFEKTPHVSLSCKLVPVQYRQYKYGLFKFGNTLRTAFKWRTGGQQQ